MYAIKWNIPSPHIYEIMLIVVLYPVDVDYIHNTVCNEIWNLIILVSILAKLLNWTKFEMPNPLNKNKTFFLFILSSFLIYQDLVKRRKSSFIFEVVFFLFVYIYYIANVSKYCKLYDQIPFKLCQFNEAWNILEQWRFVQLQAL